MGKSPKKAKRQKTRASAPGSGDSDTSAAKPARPGAGGKVQGGKPKDPDRGDEKSSVESGSDTSSRSDRTAKKRSASRKGTPAKQKNQSSRRGTGAQAPVALGPPPPPPPVQKHASANPKMVKHRMEELVKALKTSIKGSLAQQGTLSQLNEFKEALASAIGNFCTVLEDANASEGDEEEAFTFVEAIWLVGFPNEGPAQIPALTNICYDKQPLLVKLEDIQSGLIDLQVSHLNPGETLTPADIQRDLRLKSDELSKLFPSGTSLAVLALWKVEAYIRANTKSVPPVASLAQRKLDKARGKPGETAALKAHATAIKFELDCGAAARALVQHLLQKTSAMTNTQHPCLSWLVANEQKLNGQGASTAETCKIIQHLPEKWGNTPILLLPAAQTTSTVAAMDVQKHNEGEKKSRVAQDKQPAICTFFYRNGTCRYGDSCRLAHVKVVEPGRNQPKAPFKERKDQHRDKRKREPSTNAQNYKFCSRCGKHTVEDKSTHRMICADEACRHKRGTRPFGKKHNNKNSTYTVYSDDEEHGKLPCLRSELMYAENSTVGFKAPRLPINLVGLGETTALLDTGSMLSWLSAKCWRQMGSPVLLPPAAPTVRVANGGDCPVLGQVQTEIVVQTAEKGQQTLSVLLHVLEYLSYDVILGMDQLHAGVLSLGDLSLSLPIESEVQTVAILASMVSAQPDPFQGDITTTQEEEIPPSTTVTLKVRARLPTEWNEVAFSADVTNAKHEERQKVLHLHIARGRTRLTERDQVLHIFVKNTDSENSVRLRSDEVVARYSSTASADLAQIDLGAPSSGKRQPSSAGALLVQDLVSRMFPAEYPVDEGDGESDSGTQRTSSGPLSSSPRGAGERLVPQTLNDCLLIEGSVGDLDVSDIDVEATAKANLAAMGIDPMIVNDGKDSMAFLAALHSQQVVAQVHDEQKAEQHQLILARRREHLAAVDKMINRCGTRATKAQKNELKVLLLKHQLVFDAKLGVARSEPIKDLIVFKNERDQQPVRVRPYPANQLQREVLRKKIAKLLEEGVIRRSTSPYNAPCLLVKKANKTLEKDGAIASFRLVVNYAKINSVTETLAYPMHRPHLENLTGTTFMSTADVRSGFHNLELDDKNAERTAFSTEDGHFEYTRVPFGAANSPLVFVRYMNLILGDLVGDAVELFVDDFLIHTRGTFQKHLDSIGNVLARLEAANLRLNADKCDFLQDAVTYLGFRIGQNGITLKDQRAESVSSMKEPTTVAELERFTGMAGFYRNLIPNFSRQFKALLEMSKGPDRNSKRGAAAIRRQKIVWSEETKAQFIQLKTILSSQPILAHPDFTKPMRLYTDACRDGCGAKLVQIIDGTEKVLGYFSKLFSPDEKTSGDTKTWEALGVRYALQHFKQFLYASKLTIVTDHSNLVWWLKTARELPQKIARWRDDLNEFQPFTIEYKPGSTLRCADCLSRHHDCTAPTVQVGENSDYSKFKCVYCEQGPKVLTEQEEKRFFKVKITNHAHGQTATLLSAIDIASIGTVETIPEHAAKNWATMTDIQKKIVRHQIRDSHAMKILPDLLARKKNQHYRLDPVTGILCKRHTVSTLTSQSQTTWRIVLPISLTRLFVMDRHVNEKNHGGKVKKVLRSLQESYWWKSMSGDVKRIVSACKRCALAKQQRIPSQPNLLTEAPRAPRVKVFVDLITPSQKKPADDGTVAVLVMVDSFSRWLQLAPLTGMTGEDITTAFEKHWITQYTRPRVVVSDHGSNFVSGDFPVYLKNQGIQHLYAAAGQHTTIGRAERVNASIYDSVRALLQGSEDHSSWPAKLAWIAYGINTSVHTALNATPYQAFFAVDEHALSANELLVDPMGVLFEHKTDHLGHLGVGSRVLSEIREYQRKYFDRMKTRFLEAHKRVQKPFNKGDIVLVRKNTTIPKKNQVEKFVVRFSGPHLVLKVTKQKNLNLFDLSTKTYSTKHQETALHLTPSFEREGEDPEDAIWLGKIVFDITQIKDQIASFAEDHQIDRDEQKRIVNGVTQHEDNNDSDDENKFGNVASVSAHRHTAEGLQLLVHWEPSASGEKYPPSWEPLELVHHSTGFITYMNAWSVKIQKRNSKDKDSPKEESSLSSQPLQANRTRSRRRKTKKRSTSTNATAIAKRPRHTRSASKNKPTTT